MPVVLDDSQFEDWMRGTPDDEALCRRDRSVEVGAEVGNVKNNGPELMERVGLL